jgi:hypothetical protein
MAWWNIIRKREDCSRRPLGGAAHGISSLQRRASPSSADRSVYTEPLRGGLLIGDSQDLATVWPIIRLGDQTDANGIFPHVIPLLE